MPRREAKAISNLKFQISNESERQSEVEDRSKIKSESKEPGNAGGMKVNYAARQVSPKRKRGKPFGFAQDKPHSI